MNSEEQVPEGVQRHAAKACWEAIDGYVSGVSWDSDYVQGNVFREGKALRRVEVMLDAFSEAGYTLTKTPVELSCGGCANWFGREDGYGWCGRLTETGMVKIGLHSLTTKEDFACNQFEPRADGGEAR